MAQGDVTFALGIPHAPWKPERVESFARLGKALFGPHVPVETQGADKLRYRVFSDREPNWVWSYKLWSWACETGATHLLQLQDDAIVAPDFWRHLRAMVAAVPDGVIGLESVHPVAAQCVGPWYTTPDMLIGPGYVVPIPQLRMFLEWRSILRKGAIESVSEDTMLGLWTFFTGRRIWHPTPTIIDHDTDLPSTYGNDGHKYRRPEFTWSRGGKSLPASWKPFNTPSVTRFYESTPRLARRWIVGATEEDYQRWLKM